MSEANYHCTYIISKIFSVVKKFFKMDFGYERNSKKFLLTFKKFFDIIYV